MAAGGIKLGEHLAPGDYVLQISALTPDPKAAAKSRGAVQRIEFAVR